MCLLSKAATSRMGAANTMPDLFSLVSLVASYGLRAEIPVQSDPQSMVMTERVLFWSLILRGGSGSRLLPCKFRLELGLLSRAPALLLSSTPSYVDVRPSQVARQLL
jgi:hypothetical protein